MAKTELFAAFRTMASEIITEKQAAAGQTKVAGPTPADPGYQGGSSSHPTASADNGAQAASEGERSSENTADVKKQQGALSVDSTADASPGADKDNSLNLGMSQSMPGEDPSVEDNYKDKKDDPGTSHPATTEDGQKYGSANFKQASEKVIALGNKLLADVALGYTRKTAAAPAAKPAAAPAAKTAAAPAAASAETAVNILAGYDLAASIGLDKTAAVGLVEDVIENSINEAYERADLLGGFYQKLAADEAEAEGEDHTNPGGGEEAGGSGAGGGEGAPGAGGGAPAGDAGPPADMAGLAGAMGGGAPGGAPGAGGGGDEAALQELVAALMELGITPEMLAQAGQGAGGAGGGMAPPPGGDMGLGGAPGAGGPGAMPPAADPAMAGAPPMGDPMKVASLARNFMLSGRFQMKAAATKEARTMRDLMKRQILEMIRS